MGEKCPKREKRCPSPSKIPWVLKKKKETKRKEKKRKSIGSPRERQRVIVYLIGNPKEEDAREPNSENTSKAHINLR